MGNFASNRAHVDVPTTRFIWEMMNEFDLDACTPGPRELQYWDLLTEFREEGTIPFVSSNLSYVEDGEEKPLGERYLIIEKNGVKVALFALMGGSQFSSARIPDDVKVIFEDPFKTAQELVPKLQEEAELVVLMSQMTTPETNRLLEDLEGIDAALYGNLASWVQRCSKVGHAVANQTGTRGQYLGHLVMIVDPDGNVIDWGSRNMKMAENVGERPDIADLVAAHEDEMKKLTEERAQQRRGSLTEESGE